jgi:cob(I)alamin adenosyltransferase
MGLSFGNISPGGRLGKILGLDRKASLRKELKRLEEDLQDLGGNLSMKAEGLEKAPGENAVVDTILEKISEIKKQLGGD